MFDPKFYRFMNADLAEMDDSVLEDHYFSTGWEELRDPCAFFSVYLYLSNNPDVADAGKEPLDHYLTSGESEGRRAFFSTWGRDIPSVTTSADIDTCSDMLDVRYIRMQAPHLADLSDDTVKAWFTMEGWRKGIDPSPDFSTALYLQYYSDVAAAQINPLNHYILFGKGEGRLAQPSVVPMGKPAAPQEQSTGGPYKPVGLEAEMEALRHHFDAEFYGEAYTDMHDKPDRLLHYMIHGWREGRDPSPSFSTAHYLETHPDIAKSGANPFLHYVLFGQNEGRQARASDPETYVVPDHDREMAEKRLATDMDTVREDFDANWYRQTYGDVTGDAEALLRHYMSVGWREGRNPSATFSTTYYLETYVDIAESGASPLLHYVLFGRREGRRCSSKADIPLLKNKNVNLTPDLPDTGPASFAGQHAEKPRKTDPKQLDIHWILPDFRPGSGGHMTIFRMVRHLELFGHKTTIWIEDPHFHQTPHAAWETIVKHFQCVGAKVRFVTDEIYETPGDVVIATGWNTAWRVNQLKGFAARMYFVQDHEPEFYPTGAASNLARQTYDFDFGCICASPWLEKLMTDYGRWAQSFYLAYQPEQYRIAPPEEEYTGALRIAVYSRAHTDRRCVQLALAALQHLAKTRDDFEVHLFGQDDLMFIEAPFTAFNHGVLNADELAALYNNCDLGICFSGTNYSLVPQEMMACGLPLVELDTASTRAIFPKSTVTLAGPAPVDIADKIAKLLDAPATRAKQRDAALKWVQGFSWEGSARAVEDAILSYLKHTGVTLAAPAVTRTRPETLLDVVVPTWNGKDEFTPVLEALRSQRIADQVQIHCVDSTSNDGTIDWLKAQQDVSLTVIPQKEFQHGRTRNFGASLGSAPVIAFITQDALPATRDWATDIVKMMKAVPNAAGLFGRHIAYPDHPTFVREEIETHFNNMMDKPLVLSKDTDPERWEAEDIGWRQFLHFYSDNNSAMRRAVWNDIPYPEVDYGEDQVWARDIIEAGYSKIYAPTATVYHSHDYDPVQTYKRSFTEGAFFYRYFGYELGKGSEAEITRRVSREQRNVETWGCRRGVTEEEIEMRKANIAEKYRGWQDGRESITASS